MIDRLPQLGSRAAYFKQAIHDKLIEHKEYIEQARRRHAGDQRLEMGREGAGQDARHVHGRGQCVGGQT